METRELQVTEIIINQDLTLVHMPDLGMCDLHVEGDKNYMVHFLDADVFGQEFATISKGNNLFTMANDKHTKCYLFDDTQLRNIVAGVEDSHMKRSSTKRLAETAGPCTGPIVIPPIRSGK